MAKALGFQPRTAPDGIAGVDPYSHESTAAAVARLAAVVEAQGRVIGQQDAALARSREVFERASAAARLGLWECDLATETLQWSGGTYDMFTIARERPLVRRQALIRYPAQSLKTLDRIRSRAIAERTGFNLDTDIVTPDGARRWIRITATVECSGERPVRLFGLKQDITEEHERLDDIRRRAEFDDLTGLANRRQFQARLAQACGDGGGTLLLVDLDGFKDVNDSLGHAAGDACLREAAERLSALGETATIVARIGGDEFAILLGPSDRAPVLTARQIMAAMSRPIHYGWHRFRIGASIGLAVLDASGSETAMRRADAALYAAKAAGRCTFRWYDPATMRI
jgi:diguanylate cyclase (GGDEF)-like protein